MSVTNSNNLYDEHFVFKSEDGLDIKTYIWRPCDKSKAVVQIAHGMAEHALRYTEFARFLNQTGYIVYANDHRGHGQSALSVNDQGWLGPERGFELLISDMATLSRKIRSDNPELPLFLFGHSMGSFAAQRYIMDYPGLVDAVILSGSNGKQGPILSLGLFLAKLESRIKGARKKSNMMNRLSFGSYNKRFAPNRTEYDWLSRDEQAVDKYIADPYCGEVFPTGFFVELSKSLRYIEDESNFSKIPEDLPILIISGSNDPVGNFGKGVEELYQRYKERGVKDLEMKLYDGARHELVNETNKREVMEDVVRYLDARV